MDVDAAARCKNLRAKCRRAQGPEHRGLAVSEVPILERITRTGRLRATSQKLLAAGARSLAQGTARKWPQVVLWSRLCPFERPPRKNRMDSRR
jgi:hypothetical protein